MKWVCPEIEVPPNHPFIDNFSMKSTIYFHLFWGTTIYGTPPKISIQPQNSSPDPPTNSAVRVQRGGCNAAARSAVRLRGGHP